jgi:DnaD/phage-associated family protein
MSTIPNTGKLLFDESPLIIQRTLAMKLGVDEALFVQQLHYLIINKQSGSDFSTVKEGYVWVYNTWWGWQEFFPFWNQKKIQRLTDSLEDDGVIIVRKDFNQKEYDQTKWYRIDYDKLMSLPDRNYFEKEGSKEKVKKLERINKKSKAVGQNVQMVNNKGSEAPENEKSSSNPHEQPIGQNVQMQKDKMSKPIPKISIQKNSSLNNLVSKYVSVNLSPLELFEKLVNDQPSKYVQIGLNDLAEKFGSDLVNESIKRLADKNTKQYIGFLTGVLDRWTAAGAKTLEDVKTHEEQYYQQQKEEKEAARQAKKQQSSGKKSSGRKEQLPEWLEEQKQQSQEPQIEVIDLEEERRRLEEELKMYKKA